MKAKKLYSQQAFLTTKKRIVWTSLLVWPLVYMVANHQLIARNNNSNNDNRNLVSELSFPANGSDSPSPSPPLRLCLLHVGKAGGSTVGCQIQFARRGIPQCQDDPTRYPIVGNESAVSRLVKMRYHMHEMPQEMHHPSLQRCHGFVANVRSPIDRIISWYSYEDYRPHPLGIQDVTNTFKRGSRIYKDTIALYGCYPDRQTLVQEGLKPPRPSALFNASASFGGHDGRPRKMTQSECATVAWDVIQGYRRARFHNYFNYEWYFRPVFPLLQEAGNNSRPLFVIRSEHMEEDWQQINRMLGDDGGGGGGGDNSNLHQQHQQPHTPSSSAVFHQKVNAGLASAANRPALTAQGQQHLCHALCAELQLYRRILQLATNLRQDAVGESLAELHRQCPHLDLDAPCVDTGRSEQSE